MGELVRGHIDTGQRTPRIAVAISKVQGIGLGGEEGIAVSIGEMHETGKFLWTTTGHLQASHNTKIFLIELERHLHAVVNITEGVATTSGKFISIADFFAAVAIIGTSIMKGSHCSRSQDFLAIQGSFQTGCGTTRIIQVEGINGTLDFLARPCDFGLVSTGIANVKFSIVLVLKSVIDILFVCLLLVF